MKQKLLLLVNAAISIILVAAILYLVGVDEVLKQLGSIDLFYLFLSIFFLFIMDLGVTYRIRLLLNALGERPPFIGMLKSHFVGMFMADFTPARTGYFATAGVLRYKYNVPAEKAMVSIFGPQIFDFAFKLVIGSMAIFYILYTFLKPEDSWMVLIGAPFIALIIAVMLLVLFSRRFLNIFSFTKSLPIVGIIAARVMGLVERMQDKSHVVIKKTPEIIGLLLITWSLKAISWYFVAKSVGITLHTGFPEVFFYFFLQPLITMLEFIPSPTIAGLGLSEGGSTLVFSLFGIPPYQAATFALVARFKTTLLHLPAVPEVIDTIKRNDWKKELS